MLWEHGSSPLLYIIYIGSYTQPDKPERERLHKPIEDLYVCIMLKSDFLRGSAQGVKHWHKCYPMVF